MKPSHKSKQKINPAVKTGLPSDVRLKLLVIGTKHFLLEGSKGVSVRKIASEAEVNLGSFVYYFKSKDNFLEEIVLNQYSVFLSYFNVELDKTQHMTTSTEKLEFMLKRMADVADKVSVLIVRLLIDTLQGQKTVIKAFSKNPPQHALELIKIISDGQKSGEFRKDITPTLAFLLCILTVIVPQVLLVHVKNKFKNPILIPFLSELLSTQHLKIRIDFVLKGLKK